MSIQNTWNETNHPQDDDLASLLQASRLSKMSSHNPLEKIKRNLLINMCWGVLICIFYLFLLFYFRVWQIQLCVVLVLFFSLWALYTAFVQYKRIHAAVLPGNNVLQELKRHYDSITEWMKIQQQVALFIYPVSATGGFMLGGISGSNKSVEVFMNKPGILLALCIALVILVPACWYVTKWMFNYSFGKHMKVLKENIQMLEE